MRPEDRQIIFWIVCGLWAAKLMYKRCIHPAEKIIFPIIAFFLGPIWLYSEFRACIDKPDEDACPDCLHAPIIEGNKTAYVHYPECPYACANPYAYKFLVGDKES